MHSTRFLLLTCLLTAWCLIGLSTPVRAQPPAKQALSDAARPFGIARRVPWTTSRIKGSPNPPAPYRLEPVFADLQVTNPVVLTNAPDTERLFVAELSGRIYSFSPQQADAGTLQQHLFFDLAKQVPGADRLYGLTFHPEFAANRLCYICYTVGQNQDHGTRVSSFRVTGTSRPTIDAASEQIVIRWRSGGHNGGCLKFGPDGFLYISTGDAGPAFPPDPLHSGQDVSNLRSSILRIDVDHPTEAQPYSIPADNPFADWEDARPEVWAYGFRNPWKMSFDPPTGSLWVGDVGWEMWEMIYRVERAANYGWSLVEGPQPVHRERTRGPTPVSPPTVAHQHIESRSITGGFVYRGRRLPELAGEYVYGDYVTGKLWSVPVTVTEGGKARELADSGLQIICFGVDNQNELYIVAYDGTIHRLVPNAPGPQNARFPNRLSETGLFASVPEHTVAPGVIPYRIQAEPWMDGAVAERFVAIPGNARLDTYQSSNVQIGYIKGTWKFPHNSVLVKTISLPTQQDDQVGMTRLETQLLHFDVDTWRAYTYAWNESQTDAVRVRDGFDRTYTVPDTGSGDGVRTQTWHFASSTECLLCHTTRGGTIYGFNPEQLDCDQNYRLARDNQLRTLTHLGLFETPPQPRPGLIVDPHDTAASLERRARSYLHVNCAHCHRRGGGGTAAMDVQIQLPMEKTNLLDQRPTQGTFGIHGAEVVAAGDPYRSVLLYRMAKTGRGRMPHIGSTLVDQQGWQLIHDWIVRMDDVSADEQGDGIEARAQQDLAELGQGTATDLTAAVTRLLDRTASAMRLAQAIADGSLPADATAESLRLATSQSGPEIRDLFERFLPEEQRTRRLGRDVDVHDILRLEGQAAKGRAQFLTSRTLQCRNCHRLGRQGRQLGPDLDGIGKKYTRRQLLDSILRPSQNIDPKFMSYLVETTDGRVLSGLLTERSPDELVLKDPQANEVRIPVDQIDLLAPQQKSLMPDLLWQDMTAEELADLLAFLVSLKSEPSAR